MEAVKEFYECSTQCLSLPPHVYFAFARLNFETGGTVDNHWLL